MRPNPLMATLSFLAAVVTTLFPLVLYKGRIVDEAFSGLSTKDCKRQVSCNTMITSYWLPSIVLNAPAVWECNLLEIIFLLPCHNDQYLYRWWTINFSIGLKWRDSQRQSGRLLDWRMCLPSGQMAGCSEASCQRTQWRQPIDQTMKSQSSSLMIPNFTPTVSHGMPIRNPIFLPNKSPNGAGQHQDLIPPQAAHGSAPPTFCPL